MQLACLEVSFVASRCNARAFVLVIIKHGLSLRIHRHGSFTLKPLCFSSAAPSSPHLERPRLPPPFGSAAIPHPPPSRAAIITAPGLSPLRRALLSAPFESTHGSPTKRPRPPRSGPAPAGSSARRPPRLAAQHSPRRYGQRP